MTYPETWKCGHCGLEVVLPSEALEHEAFIATLVRIGEHRLGHLADALTSQNESALRRLYHEVDVTEPVTGDDVAAAVADAEAILRERCEQEGGGEHDPA